MTSKSEKNTQKIPCIIHLSLVYIEREKIVMLKSNLQRLENRVWKFNGLV